MPARPSRSPRLGLFCWPGQESEVRGQAVSGNIRNRSWLQYVDSARTPKDAVLGSILTLLVAVQPAPIDFDTDVLPVLTTAGCNAGACYGAAAGRGGFKLSLFGGDPVADYRAIVRDLEGRRVNLARPERSLLLLKPTWQVDHEGGERFASDSPQAAVLLDWVRSGSRRERAR